MSKWIGVSCRFLSDADFVGLVASCRGVTPPSRSTFSIAHDVVSSRTVTATRMIVNDVNFGDNVVRRTAQYGCVISLAFAAQCVDAQVPGTDTLRLSAEELTARAVAASPALARERLEVERARAERLNAGGFFPELPELEYRLTSDAPYANEGESTRELGISQEIELGGQYFLRREAAGLEVAAAELRLTAAEIEVRAGAREALARLAAAEARLGLLDSMNAFARRLDTAAARLLAAGEISELDRNAIHIERGRGEITRMNAEAELALARNKVAVLTGVETGTIIVTAPRQRSVDEILAHVTDVEQRLIAGDSSLLMQRPDMLALERVSERASIERRLASRAVIPNVRLGVFVESETRPVAGVAAAEGESALGTDRFLGFNVGLRIPLPIPGLYNYGQGEIAIADAEMSIAVADQRVLATRIRNDVAAASARLRSAVSAIATFSREIGPYIIRNLELLERGYRAGELSAIELITQQQQFAGAGEALIEAELELDEAYADFERAVGR